MELNIFEQATRQKLRFDSPKGLLSVEDLWSLPLQVSIKDKANLNDIAIALHHKTQSTANVISFVEPTATNEERETDLLKFNVVKHIISVKIVERDREAQAKARKEQKEKLMEALERAEGRALDSKSPEEIRAMIQAL